QLDAHELLCAAVQHIPLILSLRNKLLNPLLDFPDGYGSDRDNPGSQRFPVFRSRTDYPQIVAKPEALQRKSPIQARCVQKCMPVANEGRQVLQASDNFVVLHRGDPLAQIGYRLVEFGLAYEVKRISVFRRDLVGEKLEILSPLFGCQSRKRSFTMSKGGSKEQDAEQFLHKTSRGNPVDVLSV